jgi:tetratricopeptide (TPR) repeat protein
VKSSSLAMVVITAQDCQAVDHALITEDIPALLELGIPAPAALLSGDLKTVAEASTNDVSTAIADFLSGHCTTGPLSQPTRSPSVCSYVTGIALLKAFLRINFAGPPVSFYSDVLFSDCPESHAQLSLDGEDVCPCVRYPQILVQAKHILVNSMPQFLEAGFRNAPWWAARVCLAHTAVLSRPTPTLQRSIFSCFGMILGTESSAKDTLRKMENLVLTTKDSFRASNDQLPPTLSSRIEDIDLLALATLELSVAQLSFYDSEGASKSLAHACCLAGINVRTEGHLGTRTKFQQGPVSQLVAHVSYALAETSRRTVNPFALIFPGLTSALSSEEQSVIDSARLPVPRNIPLDDSDVLGYVKLDDSKIVNTKQSQELEEYTAASIDDLSPVEQAIVLGHASLELSRNAEHCLTDEQAAAYVELVLNAAQSRFGTSSVIQVRALLMRAGFERDRGRYMERTLTQMEDIAGFIDATLDDETCEIRHAAAIERNAMIFASGLPPRWELKKELAVCFGRLGLVKSAMEIFRELEYWDELIDCHRLVGNLGAAESIVREQLDFLESAVAKAEGDERALNKASSLRSARRPRLLCVLGDVLRDEGLYEQAWEESGSRCGRAKRSLGRLALDRKQWATAVTHYRAALELNPLYSDVWFSCGCAAIEAGDIEFAASAFTRVVQETQRNGEAWNNLGRVLCELGRLKEGLNALLEAAKYKRESWRIWDNVLLVAVRLRSPADIVKALTHLLDLRGKDAISATAIQAAVDGVLNMGSPGQSTEMSSKTIQLQDRQTTARVARELLQVLARATTFVSSDAYLWDAYARLHSHLDDKNSKQKAAECRQKQIRALTSRQEWKNEKNDFRIMVEATVDFASAALESGDETLIFAAKMHVTSTMNQTQDDFSTDEAFIALARALEALTIKDSTTSI